MRYGTVLGVSADDPPTAFHIGWDDGRQEWIRDEEFVPLRIVDRTLQQRIRQVVEPLEQVG